MYCSHSSCQKEVDINSVMKQKTSGGFALNSELTTHTYFAGRTSNELINVCKSCGNTDYLWESKEDYVAHLEYEQHRVEDDRASQELYNNKAAKKPYIMAMPRALLWLLIFIPVSIILGLIHLGAFISHGMFGFFSDKNGWYAAPFAQKDTLILAFGIPIIVGLISFWNNAQINLSLKRDADRMEKETRRAKYENFIKSKK